MRARCATNNNESPFERLMHRIDMGGPDDCWLWCGALTRCGNQLRPAMMKVDGRLASPTRLIYTMFVGPAEGLFVCHRCDVPCCLNPNHLFAGTPLDNIRDARAKGRLGKRTAWTVEESESAMVEVDAGASIRSTARKYGQHFNTLHGMLTRRDRNAALRRALGLGNK